MLVSQVLLKVTMSYEMSRPESSISTQTHIRIGVTTRTVRWRLDYDRRRSVVMKADTMGPIIRNTERYHHTGFKHRSQTDFLPTYQQETLT